MHVCIVTPFFYPLLNGASVRMYKHAIALKEAGHRVSVLSPHVGIPEIDCYQVGRPPVYFSPRLWWKMWQLHRQEKISLVISQSYIGDLFSFLPARLLGATFVCDVHGPEKEEIKATSLSPMKKAIGLFGCWLDQFVLKHADRLMGAEAENVTWLHNEFGIPLDKIIHVANFPDLNSFVPEPKQPQTFTIGYLGTLQKGRIGPLLDSMRTITDSNFLIVGDGDGKEEIPKLPHVTLTSERDYRKIPQLINRFDIGIIFSLTPQGMAHKGPPMKLFEYLACGVPVIGVNLPELADIVTKNGVGILTDIEHLNDAIATLKTRYSEFQERVTSYRRKMETEANWRVEQQKLLSLLSPRA